METGGLAAARNNDANNTTGVSSTGKKRWKLPKFLTPTPPEIKKYRKTIQSTFLQGKNEDICNFVNLNPTCCNERQSFEGLGKFYPLSVVVRRKPALKTVEIVYQANPKAIYEALPGACKNEASLEVIRFLITKHPDGAEAQYSGWNPLHIALSGKAPYNVITYLIDCYPKAVEIRADTESGLPIHIAIEHYASINIIKLLLSKYPKSIQMTDYVTTSQKEVKGWITLVGDLHPWEYCGGGLPLHIACRHNVSLQIIRFLIVTFPDALRSKNRSGYLPLHYCCASKANLDTIQIVHSCCPDALLEFTADFISPIDICVSRYNPKMDVLYYLISKHPCTGGCPPDESLYYHYFDEALNMFAGATIVRFLGDVMDQASNGYTYVFPYEI